MTGAAATSIWSPLGKGSASGASGAREIATDTRSPNATGVGEGCVGEAACVGTGVAVVRPGPFVPAQLTVRIASTIRTESALHLIVAFSRC